MYTSTIFNKFGVVRPSSESNFTTFSPLQKDPSCSFAVPRPHPHPPLIHSQLRRNRIPYYLPLPVCIFFLVYLFTGGADFINKVSMPNLSSEKPKDSFLQYLPKLKSPDSQDGNSHPLYRQPVSAYHSHFQFLLGL